jgi:hypothetical protein
MVVVTENFFTTPTNCSAISLVGGNVVPTICRVVDVEDLGVTVPLLS